MSETPGELKYTKNHEWVRKEDDGSVTVGITGYAQELMGDMVYIELPDDDELEAGKDCAVVESVKAASDVYAPVSGTVSAGNDALADSPDLVNKDPYGEGWLFRMQPSDMAEVDALMDADAYRELIESES